MKVIYKYPLEITREQIIETHEIIRILSLQNQGINPCLWALVDTNSEKRKIKIRTCLTGEDIDFDYNLYLGTTQKNGFVLHWFLL